MDGNQRPSPGRDRPGAGKGRPPRTAEERREERRRQQERALLERHRRRSRRLIVISAVVAGAILLAGLDVFLHRTTREERALLDQAPEAAAAAGCGPVKVTAPYPRGLDRTHIGGSDLPSMPPLSSYPSVPPASGPHGQVPLPAGFHPVAPPLDAAIHSLEHAAVTVWFDPAVLTSAEARRIENFFVRGNERNHVIVAPYDYPAGEAAGRLPAGSQMALVAWHHVQLCSRPSLPVAYAFVHAYRFNIYQWTAYRGDAPEKFAPI